MATGLVFKERYLWHDTGTAPQMMPPGPFAEPGTHAESAATKRRFHSLLQVSGLAEKLVRVAVEPVTEEDVLRAHTRRHLEMLRAVDPVGWAYVGEETAMGPSSYEIILLSAGGTLAALRAVMRGEVDNAYALVRPPGHHAEPETAMGYCFIGNIPVALRHLQARDGLGRVAVVDWDVHHGNGTETIHCEDPDVLTISVHQDNLYPPGRGALADIGRGRGEGFNLNIPLPAGSGNGAYEAAFDRVVLPALYAYKPEMIVVASGLDASAFDPLARQMVSSGGFRRMTAKLMTAAADLCGGRLAMSHEGGYSETYVAFCGHAVVEALSGIRTAVEDPALEQVEAWGGQALQPHQDAAIRQAEGLVAMLRRRA
jgi:acetoin utilization deacetylase AcuC-like enzyme